MNKQTSTYWYNRADSLQASANGLRSMGNTWLEIRQNKVEAEYLEHEARICRRQAEYLERQGK